MIKAKNVDVLILGSGLAGKLSAINLQKDKGYQNDSPCYLIDSFR